MEGDSPNVGMSNDDNNDDDNNGVSRRHPAGLSFWGA
jgi:hypothetical protein